MKKHKKRAALQYVALVYGSALTLTLGMLRCAQKTRQALYGGQPVMAQISPKTDVSASYEISLGGGEWVWNLQLPTTPISEQIAAHLPPCMAKWMLQFFSTMEKAVH